MTVWDSKVNNMELGPKKQTKKRTPATVKKTISYTIQENKLDISLQWKNWDNDLKAGSISLTELQKEAATSPLKLQLLLRASQIKMFSMTTDSELSYKYAVSCAFMQLGEVSLYCCFLLLEDSSAEYLKEQQPRSLASSSLGNAHSVTAVPVCKSTSSAKKQTKTRHSLEQIHEGDNFCLVSPPFLSLIHIKSKTIIKLYFILDSCRT